MIFVGSHDYLPMIYGWKSFGLGYMIVLEEQTQIILLYITRSLMPIMLSVLRTTVINILYP